MLIHAPRLQNSWNFFIKQVVHWAKWLQYLGPQNNNKEYLRIFFESQESLTVILLVGQGSAESNKAISYPKQESKIRLKISIYNLKEMSNFERNDHSKTIFLFMCWFFFFFEFSIKDFFFSCKMSNVLWEEGGEEVRWKEH